MTDLNHTDTPQLTIEDQIEKTVRITLSKESSEINNEILNAVITEMRRRIGQIQKLNLNGKIDINKQINHTIEEYQDQKMHLEYKKYMKSQKLTPLDFFSFRERTPKINQSIRFKNSTSNQDSKNLKSPMNRWRIIQKLGLRAGITFYLRINSAASDKEKYEKRTITKINPNCTITTLGSQSQIDPLTATILLNDPTSHPSSYQEEACTLPFHN